MPKYGRPFQNLENDLNESSRTKMPYFTDRWSEVQRNAPFGTHYTPQLYTKIVGSKYRKFNTDAPLTARSLSPIDFSRGRQSVQSSAVTFEDGINKKPVLPPIYAEDRTFRSLEQLTNLYIPNLSGLELSQRPINLTESDYNSLLKIIQQATNTTNDLLTKLKRAYLTLARVDVNLTGLCPFNEFMKACNSADIPLDLNHYRLLACLFVVPSRDTVPFVNYERIISFIGAAFKNYLEDNTGADINGINKSIDPATSNNNYSSLTSRPHYYYDDNDNRENAAPSQPPELRNKFKLLEVISAELGPHCVIPIAEIRLACQRIDPSHRGTLSLNQLGEICRENGVHFSERSLQAIISHCRYMGGGQFNWENFLEFLEKLQPAATSLQIPTSRMPAEFARLVPQPTPSWPHSAYDSEGQENQNHNVQEMSSRYVRDTARSYNMHNDVNESRPKEDFSQQYDKPNPKSDYLQAIQDNNALINYSSRVNTNRSQQSNSPPLYMQEPWMNRYLKFIDAIYLKDVHNTGVIPTGDLYQSSLQLSQKFNLQFDTAHIIAALQQSTVDNDSLVTDINTFLKRLSIISQENKE